MKIRVVCMFACMFVAIVGVAIAQISSPDPSQYQVVVPIGLLEDGQLDWNESVIRQQDAIFDMEHDVLLGTRAENSLEDIINAPNAFPIREIITYQRLLKVFDISDISSPQFTFEVEADVIVGYMHPYVLYGNERLELDNPYSAVLFEVLDLTDYSVRTVESDISIPPLQTSQQHGYSLGKHLFHGNAYDQIEVSNNQIWIYDWENLGNGESALNLITPVYLHENAVNSNEIMLINDELLILVVSTSFYINDDVSSGLFTPTLGTQLYVYDIASEPLNPTLLSTVELPNLNWCATDLMAWTTDFYDLRLRDSGHELELSIVSDVRIKNGPISCSATEHYLIDVADVAEPTVTAYPSFDPLPQYPSNEYFITHSSNGTYIAEAVEAKGVVYLPFLSQTPE